MSLVSLGRLALLSILLSVIGPMGAVHAHEIRPAVADAEIGADRLTLTIHLTLEPMIAGIDLEGLQDTNASPDAAQSDRLRALPPAELETALRAAWPGISRGFTLHAGETALVPEIVSVSIPEVGNTDLPRDSDLVISAPLPPGDAPVTIGWIAAYGDLVLRQMGGGEDAYAGFLTGGEVSEPLPRIGVATEGAGKVFLRYIVVGFEHIVPKGLDHILFVLGLLFFSLHIRPLLFQVSAFTLAHTTTLALASLGIVTIPASVVEPLIALSIVFVAVENVLGIGTTRSRTVVVFCFGLLHGLGFASVLGDVGIDPSRFVTALIGFNVGVEFGQLAVITGAFLAVGLWFGRKGWYRARIAVPASVVIALIGAYWSVERIFL